MSQLQERYKGSRIEPIKPEIKGYQQSLQSLHCTDKSTRFGPGSPSVHRWIKLIIPVTSIKVHMADGMEAGGEYGGRKEVECGQVTEVEGIG